MVADCGFSEIESVMKTSLRLMRLPGWLVHVASLCAKVLFGWSYQDMRPIDSLKDNKIPILFIHGAQDAFIPPFHSQAMAKATKGYSEVHLIEGAAHARSMLTAPEEYRQIVEAFLQKALSRSSWYTDEKEHFR